MFKKILPAVTGAIGFAFAGPVGASIGAGLGSAIRGDNPANIATSALMGYGLGAGAPSFGLVGGKGLGAFGASAKTALGFGTPATLPSGTAPATTRDLGLAMEAGAKKQAQTSAVRQGLAQRALQFAKDPTPAPIEAPMGPPTAKPIVPVITGRIFLNILLLACGCATK